ncbi:N-acetyl-alpha-D-glucosaminyl L-malate deacetylase 1 [subsurface metagenome]
MNVLGVGAHFDDLEVGCSGSLIRHVMNGDRVTMVVVTDSSYKNADGVVIREADIAMQEGQKAAELIGADLITLGYKTFYVPFDEALSKELMHIVESRQIDVVYGHWIHDIHRDHQLAGRATMMAGRHVPRFLMYRSNYYDSDQQFKGNFYVDITDVMERKIEVIKAHQSELERVRYAWLDFFTKQNGNEGQKIGVKYAECFEIVRYLV